MKFKSFAAILLAASTMSAFAQGYKDGVEYYKAGRIELAQELLEKNLNNSDTDKAAAYYYLGLIQLDYYNYDMRRNKSADAAKELKAAADYFNKGVAANPEYAFNYAGLGEISLLNNDAKAAQENFKKAEKLANKDAGVNAAIARAYYNVSKIKGNPELYAKEIKKQEENAQKLMYKRLMAPAGKADYQPNDQDYYIFLGDKIFDTAGADKKLVGDACNEYERAISIDPQDAAAYVKYADTYFQIKPEISIAQLRELLKNAPTSALGQRELAEALYKDGQIAKATTEYAKLIKNPNHFKSDENRYLELLYFAKDFNKGFDESAAIIASDPDNISARSWNYVFAHEIKSPKAVELARQLLEAQKKNTKAKLPYGVYPMIARDLNEAQLPEEAISVLQLGLQQYPDNLDMLKDTASALYAIDRNAEAADMLAQYIAKQSPDKVTGTEQWTLSTYAVIAGQNADDPAIQNKYFDLSIDAARKSESKLAGPYKYLTHKRIGDIAQLRKQDEAAFAEYVTAIQLMEDNNVVADNAKDAMAMYRFVGVAAHNRKDNAMARNMLTKYQALNPGDAAVNDILKRTK